MRHRFNQENCSIARTLDVIGDWWTLLIVRELEDYMSTEDAEAVLATAISWGRYAELFEYDATAGVLSKEPLAPAHD